MTELEDFHLPGNKQVTDKTVARMRPLAKLERLYLISSPITDVALAHLKSHTKLKRLILANTHVTDQGLPYLYSLDQLELLSLDACNVTAAALQRLQHELPNTQIVAEPQN